MIRIGARGSILALAQAEHLKTLLSKKGHHTSIVKIKTKGDVNLTDSFDKIEGKGFFTKEIEKALLDDTIDIAVHSYKDLPTQVVPKTKIACVLKREIHADILLINKEAVDYNRPLLIKKNAIVGTSSNRRKSQLLSLRNDLNIEALRGNILTRIEKLRTKKYDAIVLAHAGIKRIDFDMNAFETYLFNEIEMTPAAGQGALAVQIKEDRLDLQALLEPFNDKQTQETTALEKKVLERFNCGCHSPIGVYCDMEQGRYILHTSFAHSGEEFSYKTAIQSDDATQLIQKTCQIFRNPTLSFRSLFISRTLKEYSYLYTFLKHFDIQTHHASLIKTSKLSDISPIDVAAFDVVFFPSSKSVQYFFETYGSIPQNIRLLTMGTGSAATLLKYRYKPTDIGNSNDPIKIAEEWAYKYKKHNILIPCALNSSNKIKNILEKHASVTSLPLYKTEPKKNIPKSNEDILIFSSPSNAKAYFSNHLLQPHQRIIAFGKTTQEELLKYNINSTLPFQSSELGIAQILLDI